VCCFSDKDGGGDDMENKDTNTYEKNECIKWAVEDAVKTTLGPFTFTVLLRF